MKFGHEQLDIGRVSIWHLARAHEAAKRSGSIDRPARDQLLLDSDYDYDNDNDNGATDGR